MQRTARGLGEERWRMVRSDAFAFIGSQRSSYDIVFADPPFAMEGIDRLPGLVQRAGLLGTEGLFIVEHPDRIRLEHLPGFLRQRSYGLIRFSFFGPAATPPDA
jgi:16S rRNA G966 N2-methylase RsmD